MTAPSPELTYATLSAALTGSLWVPIIVNRLREMGIWKALANPEPDVRPNASWANSRLAHALVYTFGVPLLRTVAFLVGFGAQAVMLLRILGAV